MHTVHANQSALQDNRQFPYTAQSPDLSPVEHLWNMMEQLACLVRPFTTLHILKDSIRHIQSSAYASKGLSKDHIQCNMVN